MLDHIIRQDMIMYSCI